MLRAANDSANRTRRGYRRCVKVIPCLGASAVALSIAPLAAQVRVELQPETAAAFEEFATDVDKQFSWRLQTDTSFLWSEEQSRRGERLQRGDIVVEPSDGKGAREIPGGLIHDWTAAMLVPDVDIDAVVGIVTSYDSHAATYRPAVIRSRILSRDGSRLRVSMRLVKSKVLTAVLETEHHAEFQLLDSCRWWGRSRSISVREVVHAGKANETLRPEGHDSGFLWRLNVYWRFSAASRGIVVEHRALSLTRDLPKGLRWLLRPVLVALPRQSLTDMMKKTRDAALAGRTDRWQ